MSEYTPTTEEVRDSYDYQFTLGMSDISRIAEFDRWLAQVKADALLKLAKSIDLEAVANEWSGGTDDGRWSAGNGASSVLNAAYDMATRLQKEAKK